MQSEQSDFERLELRVQASQPGSRHVVDRGKRDGLEVGDLVRLYPRRGGSLQALVIEVEERSALVEIADALVQLPAGTRGEVLVPRERFEHPTDDAQPDSEWENDDEGWIPEMPLLAQIRPLRPNERRTRFDARLYAIGDQRFTSQDDRSDAFYRIGQDLRWQNLFGRGGTLHADLEQTYRHVTIPDEEDDTLRHLRVDRLSYTWGDTRFRPRALRVRSLLAERDARVRHRRRDRVRAPAGGRSALRC